LLLTTVDGFTQNPVTEFSGFECSHSKVIQVPFQEKLGVSKEKDRLSIDQSVFYTHGDQLSFWYKLVADEDQIISFKVNALETGDRYSIYAYRDKDDDFCEKVFKAKIKPLKPNFFLKKNPGEAYELTDIKFKVKKGEIYHLCVLNTSPSNCGHDMIMSYGKDTLKVKALHFPCGDGGLELISENKNTQSYEEGENYLTANVKVLDRSDHSKKLDATITLTDRLRKKDNQSSVKANEVSVIKIVDGRSYRVQCNSVGYKELDQTYVITDSMLRKGGMQELVVYMDHLESGDKFTMNHIYFYPNTYALKQNADKEIDLLYDLMVNRPALRVELQGHTNGNSKISKNKAYKSRGPEWNFEGSSKKLSIKRAETIKIQLVKKGIDPKRMETAGFGGERMIVAKARTVEAIRKNIRVEVIIL